MGRRSTRRSGRPAESGRVALTPSVSLETRGNGDTRWNRAFASCLVSRIVRHGDGLDETESVIHTIFEGTSEIQQLVIARAISGMRIE